MGIGLARMVFIAFTARLAPGSVVGGDGWGGSSVISTSLSYQSKDACFLRARLSTRKDPARSHHSKSKGHISRTMGVLHTALGHRSDGCIPCYPSGCPFICIHIGILSLDRRLVFEFL